MRQARYDGGYYAQSYADGVLRLQALPDADDVGPELGVAFRVRLGGWFGLRTTLDAFAPLEPVIDGEDFTPLFTWDTTISLDLNRWAALVYQATIHRDHPLIEDLQTRQVLSLRFHYTVL